jgi:competence protein ComEC
VFVAVRMMLAAVPAIALRYPIKKWAAAAALLAAGAYLLLSGSSIATVRAFIMIAIMFLAVMLDRPALAMRNVALSALVILVVAPESLLDAGFQMSFAAVVSLISAYELVRDRRDEGAERGTLLRLAFFLGGIVLSTVIASLAVAPFAAYHFHRSQQYALLANLVAIPICNLIVMPAGLLTLVLMPFGLEALPLWVMEQGIAAVVWSARFVAALPGAVAHIPAIGDAAFALMVVGGLWLTLWRTRWRALGLGAIAAGIALATQTPRPDVLAGLDGALVAARGVDGRLAAASTGRATYELKRWLEHDGDSREAKDVLKDRLFRCDGVGCVARTVQGTTLSVVRHGAAFGDDCAAATILVASIPAPKVCEKPALVLDYPGFRRDGGYAIYFDPRPASASAVVEPPAMRVETIAARRGDRPWALQMRVPPRPPPEPSPRRNEATAEDADTLRLETDQ